jgi:hypothetical protein
MQKSPTVLMRDRGKLLKEVPYKLKLAFLILRCASRDSTNHYLKIFKKKTCIEHIEFFFFLVIFPKQYNVTTTDTAITLC